MDNSPSSSPISSTLFASSFSGLLARIPLHPIDTIKAKLQISNPALQTPLYTGFRHCFMDTFRKEGLSGLYKGFPIAFFGSAPAACLYFTSYEFNKKILDNMDIMKNHQFINNFTAGLLAECISCILWVPIDVIKERFQVQSNVIYALNKSPNAAHRSSHIAYSSTINAILTISRTEGLRGIYRGYGATVASFGPYSALYLSLYEQFKLLATNLTKAPSSDHLPFHWYLLCGASSGGLASFITNPLDLAKLRIQVQRGNSGFTFGYKNLVHGIGQIIETEGIQALFKGAATRMAFFVPSAAITITLFDTLKNYANQHFNKNT